MPYDRATLHAETDERYHARHMDAPYTIDPSNDEHRPWISAWREIRDEVLVAATNHYFFEQYPGAPPHLDPKDPAQNHYVAEWIRIRDDILGDGIDDVPGDNSSSNTTNTAPTAPDTTEFDDAAERVRQHITAVLQVGGLTTDNDAVRHVQAQLDVARSLYLGRHFDQNAEWTSPTHDFDIGVGFNNLGVQVRAVGGTRSIRMGLVGDGPSDVGGWETYNGAPTQ